MDSKIKSAQYYSNVFENVLTEVMPFDVHTRTETDICEAWKLYSETQKAIDLAISTLQQMKIDVRFQMGLFVIENDN